VVVRGCQYYLCDVKSEGVVAITTVLADMARVFHRHIPQLIQPLLPMVLRKLLDEPVCFMNHVHILYSTNILYMYCLGSSTHYCCFS